MSDITLTASARNSLLSLTGTASLMSRTQGRLTTGLKVASAIDDAISFFKAKGLTDRATDFSVRKDEIDQGISSLKGAINGTTLVDSLLKQMKGVVNSVRTADSATRTALSSQFNDLAKQINSAMGDASYQGLNLVDNSSASMTVYFNQGTSASLNVHAKNMRASKLMTSIAIGTDHAGFNAVGDMLGVAGASSDTPAVAKAIAAAAAADKTYTAIGSAAAAAAGGGHAGAVAATTAVFTYATSQVTAATQGVTDATATGSAQAIADANVKLAAANAALVGATTAQTAVTGDATGTLSYSDVAKLGTAATLSTARTNAGGGAAAPLTGFSSLTSQTSISPATILDHMSAMIDKATSSIRSQSALLGGNVTFLQSRMDFTSNYINTLQEGSGKLTLADLNEEGANLVSLQTRQQIGIQSLSIAGQQQQAILSLLR